MFRTFFSVLILLGSLLLLSILVSQSRAQSPLQGNSIVPSDDVESAADIPSSDATNERDDSDRPGSVRTKPLRHRLRWADEMTASRDEDRSRASSRFTLSDERLLNSTPLRDPATETSNVGPSSDEASRDASELNRELIDALHAAVTGRAASDDESNVESKIESTDTSNDVGALVRNESAAQDVAANPPAEPDFRPSSESPFGGEEGRGIQVPSSKDARPADAGELTAPGELETGDAPAEETPPNEELQGFVDVTNRDENAEPATDGESPLAAETRDDERHEANAGTDVVGVGDGPVQVDAEELNNIDTAAPAVDAEQDSSSKELSTSNSDSPQRSAAPPITPAESRVFTPEQTVLRERIRDCLAIQFSQPESAQERSPWGLMHALIAYGVDSEILANGRRVNAASWLCWNGSGRGMKLMYMNRGEIEVRQGPGYQGHPAQLLAILAQCRVPRDYPMQVDGHKLTVEDLIEHEKKNCRSKTELTFSLIGLSHYLESDAVWRSRQGQSWNVERLIQEEISQPIVGAACGGTHRLMGLSYAVRRRASESRPINGQWKRADAFVREYQQYAFSLQNPDGSYSTEWFERRAHEPSIDRRLQTTGHILEWMVFSLPKEELDSPRVVRAVNFLTDLMLEQPRKKWEVGPRGHAIRALALYDQRYFGGSYGDRETQLAERLEKLRTR